MTNQNKELIESIMNDQMINIVWKQWILKRILQNHLSNKIIIEKEKIEELIDRYKKEDKAEQSIEAGIVLQDLKSLIK